MDLINRDELLQHLEEESRTAPNSIALNAFVEIKGYVNRMPTVDAVPISVIESWLYEIERNNSRNYLSDACVEIISRLGGLKRYYEEKFCTEQMPRVDAVPVRHGHWKHDETGANFCSVCNEFPYDDGEYHLVWHKDYCPYCGAKMDEEETE